MITSYEIKKINDEEQLYLYFDFNNEFSKLNFKEKREKLQELIKDFINENKIIFKGTTVALIVGGTIVGNIILNNDFKSTNNTQNNVSYEEKIEYEEIPNDIIKELKEEPTTSDALKEEMDNNYDVKNSSKVIMKDSLNNKSIQSEPVKVNTTSNNINSIDDNVESVIVNEQNQIEVNEEIKNDIVEEKIDNNIYVAIKRANGTLIDLELEEYIIGVVGAEMPAAFHNQALMAQAIIARTYALKLLSRGQILTDSESTQSYKSNEELKSMWGSSYNTYYNKIKNAVYDTEGMYLTYNGDYIEAVYHSTSNGQTEDSRNVWENYFPYLISVSSEYDKDNPTFIQEKSISYQELSSKLQSDISIDTEFNIISKTPSNRVETIEVNGKTYKGVDFRNILGLRSTDFDIAKTDNGFIFTTRGYGHGVGMSQYGANGMAKAGYSYTQILKHYYQGVSINHL